MRPALCVLALGACLVVAARESAADPAPTPAASDPAGRGLVVRLIGGVAFVDESQSGLDLEGFGPAGTIEVGVATRPALYLGGTAYLRYVTDPDFAIESRLPEPDTLTEVGLGPQLSYDFAPRDVHVGAALALDQVRHGRAVAGTGLSLLVSLGVEVRVASWLALGVAGQAYLGAAWSSARTLTTAGGGLGISAAFP